MERTDGQLAENETPPGPGAKHRRGWRWLGLALLLALGHSAPASASFQVLTSADNETIAPDMVVLRYAGPILRPMAADLTALWETLRPDFQRVLLDLDSPGGTLDETERVIAAIDMIRQTARFDTLVRHGATCASACVAVFMQGEQRSAGGASAWMFHGACQAYSNVPSPKLTDDFLDLLRVAGVSEGFLCEIVEKGYVTMPGKYWLSGYELFHVHDANIITRLLEPWQPEPPVFPPMAPTLPPR